MATSETLSALPSCPCIPGLGLIPSLEDSRTLFDDVETRIFAALPHRHAKRATSLWLKGEHPVPDHVAAQVWMVKLGGYGGGVIGTRLDHASAFKVSSVWMLRVAMEVVYGVDTDAATLIDELYHGTWFNEYRRRESILAHAALGGRLVHGCQGAPNMSGGVVVPFGTDMERFRAELSAMRLPWIDAIRAST